PPGPRSLRPGPAEMARPTEAAHARSSIRRSCPSRSHPSALGSAKLLLVLLAEVCCSPPAQGVRSSRVAALALTLPEGRPTVAARVPGNAKRLAPFRRDRFALGSNG